MSNYTIVTDSGCDLAPELLEQWGVRCVDLRFHFEDEARDFCNRDMKPADFYDQMRKGRVARTAAANVAQMRQVFEPELQARQDVLYLGFSASLSNSCNAAQMAAKELLEEYPQRRILTLDTCCASAGLGLLVYLCAGERATGASMTELARFAMQTAPKVCHWFTVNDLGFLKRGGRVSAATALAGSILHIQPVMHMDDAGRLTNVHKVRGRRQAIAALAQRYFDTSEGGAYFISHGDCAEDAKTLERILYDRTGRSAAKITDIGPVIGAHSGPGTLAVFFVGKRR